MGNNNNSNNNNNNNDNAELKTELYAHTSLVDVLRGGLKGRVGRAEDVPK